MYFEELKVGMTVQIPPALIEKEQMMDFARTYDNIPLHTDECYAKASPFGALIAPGVMSFMTLAYALFQSCLFALAPLFDFISDGFRIILCAVIASALGAWLMPQPVNDEEEEALE